MSEFKYISLWMDSLSGLLGRVNFYNREPEVPGRVYELTQILRQPTEGDTPGGHVTEGWIGIVKVTTPLTAPPDEVYTPQGQELLNSIKEHGTSAVSLPDPDFKPDVKGGDKFTDGYPNNPTFLD